MENICHSSLSTTTMCVFSDSEEQMVMMVCEELHVVDEHALGDRSATSP